MKATIAALLVGMIAVTTSVSTHGQPANCPQSPTDTTGWIWHDEGNFSIKLPPRFETVEAESVDSKVGRWESGGFFVYYDFGIYSNPLDPEKQGSFPDMTVCEQSEGISPRIVVYRDEADKSVHMGAHWPELPLNVFHRTALTLVGTAPDRHTRSELLAVIQSVRWNQDNE